MGTIFGKKRRKKDFRLFESVSVYVFITSGTMEGFFFVEIYS